MIVRRMPGGALESLPRAEQPGQKAPVRNVMISDDNEAGVRHPLDPAARRLELVGQALLGDVARYQDQIVGRLMGVSDCGLTGEFVLAPEMNVGELKDTPH